MTVKGQGMIVPMAKGKSKNEFFELSQSRSCVWNSYPPWKLSSGTCCFLEETALQENCGAWAAPWRKIGGDVGVDRQWHWEQVKNATFLKKKFQRTMLGEMVWKWEQTMIITPRSWWESTKHRILASVNRAFWEP